MLELARPRLHLVDARPQIGDVVAQGELAELGSYGLDASHELLELARERVPEAGRVAKPGAPVVIQVWGLVRAMTSAGGFGAILGADQQAAARDAIVEALAVCRRPGGGYRMRNEWHHLIARAAS